MACFLIGKDSISLTIPCFAEINKITFYEIFVKIGPVSWKVNHRYSDFVTLHEKLVMDHCVSKDILPPKKIIGKRDPKFVEQRRIGLENYLTAVVSFLKEAMPRTLALFLDLHKYDILFLLQEMSFCFLNEGDFILSKSKRFKFNPLQVSISLIINNIVIGITMGPFLYFKSIFFKTPIKNDLGFNSDWM